MPRNDFEMSAMIANALVVGSALSEGQLESAYRHFKTLSDTLAVSGPRFGDAKLEAARLGNVALSRLRADRVKVAEAKLRDETYDGLEEIH